MRFHILTLMKVARVSAGANEAARKFVSGSHLINTLAGAKSPVAKIVARFMR